jgi:hypothetical protein
MTLIVPSNIKRASLEATITRADGTVVNLGTIAYTDRNWVRRVAYNFVIALKSLKRRISG